MTFPSNIDLSPSVTVSTQLFEETIYQFVDIPGHPSIQERIIRTQEDHVKKALTDLGWVCRAGPIDLADALRELDAVGAPGVASTAIREAWREFEQTKEKR